MRKSSLAISVLFTVALTVSGCDFFRKLAGRPTSSDIEAIREAIAQKEQAKAASLDTVAAVQPEPDVPVAVQEQAVSASPSQKEGKKRYYLIVASFSQKENALKCVERMAERGYPGELLGFKGGYTAVGICGTDDEAQAKESLKEFKRQDFCPNGVWILDRNKR